MQNNDGTKNKRKEGEIYPSDHRIQRLFKQQSNGGTTVRAPIDIKAWLMYRIRQTL